MRAFRDAKELRTFLPEDAQFHEYTAVLGEGDPAPKLAVVKYQPSGWDLAGFKPFLGRDGLPIRRHLFQQGIPAYYTTVFPFFKGPAKVPTKIVRQAAPAVAEEFNRIPVTKYLLMGADAARFCPLFSYPFKRFDEVVGRTITIDERTFRVTHAPAAVAGNAAMFQSFLDGLEDLLNPGAVAKVPAPEFERYTVVRNRLQARHAFARVANPVALDLETTGTDPYTDRILTLQISWEEGVGYAFPWPLFTPDEWGELLGGRKFVFQNAPFDIKFLAQHGVLVSAHEDAMLMHSLVDETPGTHSMELMSNRYLGVDKWGDTVDYDALKYGLADPIVPVPGIVDGEPTETLLNVGRYGARDTDLTLRLANHFRPQVENRYVHKVLTRAHNAVIRSEIRGIKIDREKAQQFQDEIQAALHDRQIYLADVHGLENANSPAQVQQALANAGIVLPKTKGKVSTNSATLEPFAQSHSVIRDILEYRHLTKAGSTYVRNILAASERDGRYHPEYKLAATETGRVTEKLITLIPRADDLKDPDLGKQYQIRLRELFIPDEGMVMIGADFRGLEVGMGAWLTNDPQLIADYNSNLDTHSVVAIEAFDLPIDVEPRATLKKRVQAEHAYYRELAKRGTFTWLYGGSEKALQEQLKIPFELAHKILTALRARYQGVARWQEAIQETVRRNGTATTPWGRSRRFLIHDAVDERLIQDQLREAINAPNQGMSSDVNLAAFAEIESRGIQTLFPFHDAVYVQAPEDQVDAVSRIVKQTMEGVLPGPVRFEADVKSGPNWAALG